MATLNVTFKGISTHFRDVVPGIRHRTVLPDATALRFGYVHLGWLGMNLPFYSLPHFPMLLTPPGIPRPTVDGVIEDGAIYMGAHLKVINEVGDGVEYTPSYDNGFSLMSYTPQYSYSDDVVFGGRAACYFDTQSGVVETAQHGPNLAQNVAITMITDGPPQLQVTPFSYRPTRAKTTIVTLQNDPTTPIDVYELTVANIDLSPGHDDVQFDFILNYLTGRGGIPETITAPLPGLDPIDQTSFRQSPDGPLKAMKHLSSLITTGRPSSAQMDAVRVTMDEVTLACSDSRYP